MKRDEKELFRRSKEADAGAFGRIVTMAEKTLQEYRLPRGFARQCICGCRRAQQARSKERPKGR